MDAEVLEIFRYWQKQRTLVAWTPDHYCRSEKRIRVLDIDDFETEMFLVFQEEGSEEELCWQIDEGTWKVVNPRDLSLDKFAVRPLRLVVQQEENGKDVLFFEEPVC